MHESLNREHVIGGLHVTENNFNVTRVTSHKHEVKLLKPIEILIHFQRSMARLGKKATKGLGFDALASGGMKTRR